ncbi:MAG: Gfo/Idh/MocA family oxidoreductase [Brevefilum sp.]
MTKPIKILLFGAGNRGAQVYGQWGLEHPDEVQFVAVAEPNPVRREQFAQAHQIPAERQFETWQEALKAGVIADAVLNATQDEMHHDSAIAAIEAGYDMLLEKPIAPTLPETLEIIRTAEDSGRLLMICHVLRYTGFFQKVHQILNSDRLGQVIHIAHNENVSYFHMAHSYVRGNWRSTDQSAPMILAKCCHDLDLLYWFLGEKTTQLNSQGNLRHFQEKNAPDGAPERCTDGCPAAETCPFYAPRIYIQSLPIKAAVAQSSRPLIRSIGKLAIHQPRLAGYLGKIITPMGTLTEYSGWPRSTITEFPESDEAVYEALRHGPYGRCVYRCDNDVVDHQVVSMEFPNGITATLTMHGHSHEESRTIRVDGSKATLLGKFAFSQAWLEIHPHFPGAEVEGFSFPTEVDQTSGHGGGDAGLMQRFVKAMRGEQAPLTSARDSLESHLMAFAAEQSRLKDKRIDMDEYRYQAIQ